MELKFDRKMVDGRFWGYECLTDDLYFFFGSAHVTREELQKYFSQYEFALLRQVHGRELVEADSQVQQTADAHWSTRKNVALVIQTADCLPILMAAGTGHILAIHAGWRGVAQEIAGRCANWLTSRGAHSVRVAIGPHIQFRHFEVGREILNQFQSSPLDSDIGDHPDPQKCRLNLCSLVERQIQKHVAFARPPVVLPDSTLDCADFHSYRRGKKTSARNFSFLVRV